MIELLAGIGVGGGVAIASGFVGNVMGFARGRAERNIAALFTTGQTDALWCTCAHALSYHKDKGGRCQHRDHNPNPSTQCRCTKFVGDPSKNPKPTTPRGALDLD